MEKINKVIIIILDGVGIGELPDATKYGDTGSNTLGNIAQAVNIFDLPNLQKLGLGNIDPQNKIKAVQNPLANYGKCAEKSPGKDSTSGHWEIGGLVLDFDFPYFPKGFPKRILDLFKEKTGLDVLGNKAASGTEILKELGEEHFKTGKPIVYTSADSVFQIAAHEKIITPEKLYNICKITRKFLTGKDAVARVIARPFVGENATDFKRTSGRRDFSLKPHKPTMLSILKNEGISTIGVGKIDDLFAGDGLDVKIHTTSNSEGIKITLEQIKLLNKGLLITNLVDFDMLYGHRNNIKGFYKALQEFDEKLPQILSAMDEDSVLFITADHGNDPTTISTDHSREYIPLIVYGKALNKGVNLGIRPTFADIGATVVDIFKVPKTLNGDSFLKKLN